MTAECRQPIIPPTSRMPAWRRKSMAYQWIMTSLARKRHDYSSEIAEILTITNHEVMSCAKQINVVHPGYLKLTMVEVNGPLVLTELGLKLIETDLEEHSDPEGCVLLHNFVDLFSKEFFGKGLVNKWVDMIWKKKEVYVIPGEKAQELNFPIYIAFKISLGFWVDETSRNLVVDHGLVITDKKISAYLIEKGPNFPTDRNQVSRTWLCMMNREKVLEIQGQSSNFRK